MTSNPLDHFNYMDLTFWSDDEKINKKLEIIYSKILPKLGKATKRNELTYKNNLKIAVLNLYRNYSLDPKLYTAFSRDKSFIWYKSNFRYNKNNATYVIVKIIDALHETGLAEDYHIGIRSEKYNKLSRIKASKQLIDIIYQYDFNKNSINKNTEIIVLRAKKKIKVINGKRKKEKKGKLIDYPDDKETIRMRNNLRLINTFISEHKIRLPNLIEKLYESKRKYPIDYSQNYLRRIFTNGSFQEGGRFYGHWVHNLPKKYRKYIRINGSRISEIDYREFHIRLLYNYIYPDTPIGNDLYGVIGNLPSKRKLLKKILNAHLCAKSSIHALKGVFNDIQKDEKFKDISIEEIESHSDMLLKKHNIVGPYLNQGYGTFLQRIDSNLTEKILLRLVNLNVPVVPIHDSYIVPKENEEQLELAMKEEYFKLFNEIPLYKKEH